MLYIMVFNIIQMNSMLASLSAAGALVGVAWGYLSKLTFFTGAKYYVSQQLAQMQVHHYNKKSITDAAKASNQDRFQNLVQQIFKDYEDGIKYKQYCWITNGTKWKCIENSTNICGTQKFGGIFPPIASLEHMVKPCELWKDGSDWETPWLKVANAYKDSYLSDLEYYVLQLEAMEQDMAILKF